MAEQQSERERLIEVAVELCSALGYGEIELGAVAARAGVAAERAEEIFPGGLEEVLAAGENAILVEVVQAVSRAYAPDRPEWESVIAGVRVVLEMMAAHPHFAYLGYIAARQMVPGQARSIYESGQAMLEAMLERGWNYSPRSAQPAKAALGVLGGAQALVRRELAAGRAERLPDLTADCVYIATVPFLGQQEALRLAREAR